MTKRVLTVVIALMLCLSFAVSSLAVQERQASGNCYMTPSGRKVSFSGFSSSAQTEDTIKITVILWEQRGSNWYEVDRISAQENYSDFVSASNSFTVDGGRYYKVTGTHYSKKGGSSYSVTSETATVWIA